MGETFPAFPCHAQPAILRIWQEDHDGDIYNCKCFWWIHVHPELFESLFTIITADRFRRHFFNVLLLLFNLLHSLQTISHILNIWEKIKMFSDRVKCVEAFYQRGISEIAQLWLAYNIVLKHPCCFMFWCHFTSICPVTASIIHQYLYVTCQQFYQPFLLVLYVHCCQLCPSPCHLH